MKFVAISYWFFPSGVSLKAALPLVLILSIRRRVPFLLSLLVPNAQEVQNPSLHFLFPPLTSSFPKTLIIHDDRTGAASLGGGVLPSHPWKPHLQVSKLLQVSYLDLNGMNLQLEKPGAHCTQNMLQLMLKWAGIYTARERGAHTPLPAIHLHNCLYIDMNIN